jgi:DNA primase
VGEASPASVRGLVAELSVAPLPVRFDPSTGLPPQRYLGSLVAGVRDAHLGRLIADAMASLRRAENDPASGPERVHEFRTTLQALEIERVRLREGVP